jgi:hypothetical protein
MGRSVSYLNNAEYVLYFPFESEYNEAGEYDDFLSQLNWDDLIKNLTSEIQAKLPSYYEVKDKWDNRETKIILENNLCIIGISEYCGLVSLSIAIKDNEYDLWHEQLALHHAGQIRKTLEKVLDNLSLNRLNKMGTFSNGESVYQKAK